MQILLTPKEAAELISLINEDAKKLIKEKITDVDSKIEFDDFMSKINNVYILLRYINYNLEYLHYNTISKDYGFSKNKCLNSTSSSIVFFDSIESALDFVKLHPEFKKDNIKLKIGKILEISPNNEIFKIETSITIDDMYQ